jgi:hypothetical protein
MPSYRQTRCSEILNQLSIELQLNLFPQNNNKKAGIDLLACSLQVLTVG